MSERDDTVDELESKVERLEATVGGLTEELVAVNKRLETLENERAGVVDGRRGPERAGTDESDEAKSQEPQDEDETGDDTESGDDIIVA